MSLVELQQDGRVLRVALNRPEKRNALNLALCRELVSAFDHAESDSSVGAVLLTGNGKAFCAGMDLAEVLEADRSALEQVHEQLFTVGSRIGKPVIAAVHGPALAGGTGLAANAHILVAGEQATFGLTEIRIGLWPILIFRTVKLAVGERRAVELSLTGRTFGAREALDFGLVHEIAASPLERAAEIASQISHLSSEAIRLGLTYVNQTRDRTWDESGRIGAEIRRQALASPDFEQGVRSFFRKP